MDYQQTLDYLYSFLDFEKDPRSRAAAVYDLRRVNEVLARLGNPHLKIPAVHVAGTKGKGSTAAMIASALIASGYVTGLHTSPHLIDIRERFRIDDKWISEREIIDLTAAIRPHVDEVNRKATYGQLTTFEALTVLSFVYFERKKADFQVVEVGLGGRLDATNVLRPEVSVITSISYDHMEVLGDTLTKIATEKAGIIKPNGTVVLAPQVDEVSRTIEAVSRERKARLIKVRSDVTYRGLVSNLDQQTLTVTGRLATYELSIPLLGAHQLDNAATAVAAMEVLQEKGFKITSDSIARGLARVNWPGRLQILNRQPLVVADGAHNVDSFQKLKQSLRQYFNYDRAILIVGMSFDKEIPMMVAEVAPVFDRVIATHSWHPRALAPEKLVAEFDRHGVQAETSGSVAEAISKAVSMAGKHDLICITGSLFVVGEALEESGKLNLTA
ncbi:MAG: bifunctional folylpolyglutamate synthase/dihydrofolate synthase [Chloroflexi bacterium]|nr:bifunctional folylpolyglutamate synthase/dihydrofolate synthase [Chloroflexota bacterium]